MKVIDTFVIRKRGIVATVTLEENGPQPGDRLRQVRDGVEWRIIGVEWWALPRTPERPGRGDEVGILLPESATVRAGDEVSIVRAEQR